MWIWIIAIVIALVVLSIIIVIIAHRRDEQDAERARLEATLNWDLDNNANWGQMNKEASEKVSEVVHDATKRYLDIK